MLIVSRWAVQAVLANLGPLISDSTTDPTAKGIFTFIIPLAFINNILSGRYPSNPFTP